MPAPPQASAGDWLDSPFGRVRLACYRPPPRAPVRAWDAADEYVLAELYGRSLPRVSGPLIINDRAGALAVALREYRPISWSDSHVAHRALAANLASNRASEEAVRTLPSTQAPSEPCQLAIVKVPKSLSLLETQLHALRPQLSATSTIIGAGMTRHIHKSTLVLFERILGPTTTSLARKKARLIRVTFDPQLTVAPTPASTRWRLPANALSPPLQMALEFENRANVFSRNRLDPGSYLLLSHFPGCVESRDVVDVGCGNGVLGCVAGYRAPGAELWFTDESYLAVATARANFARIHPGRAASAHFAVTDCLDGLTPRSADLILCNPPFHQQHAVGAHVAARMFREAAQVARDDGRLIVVGNRHLPYPRVLREFFARVQTIASDRQFMVIDARRPR